MREVFVGEIVKEALGPRNGSKECMRESPLDEYLSGVLIPRNGRDTTGEIDGENDLAEGEQGGDSVEDRSDSSISSSAILSPSIDPKRRPSSMGISFTLKSSTPSISVCITWATYSKSEQDGGEECYKRQPKAKIVRISNTPSGKQTIDEDANIALRVTLKKLQSSNYLYRYSLFLVNENTMSNDEGVNINKCIFQPQIRISLDNGTIIERGNPVPSNGDEEEAELSYLYRNRVETSRGHMCSVVSKEYDPQIIPDKLKTPYSKGLAGNPAFVWVDGAESGNLSDDEIRRFSKPDLRTDFIPLYFVPAPKYNDEKDNLPELEAEVLSEVWDSNELRDTMSPLVSQFEQWVEENVKKRANSNDKVDSVISALSNRSEQVSKRMRSGLELLTNDTDARLAFCFANKAMSIQHNWKKRKDNLTWRPFQIAYFLVTVQSIFDPHSTERELCDLLWVPTGAGKTEAYLLIIAFTFALRRLRADKEGGMDGLSVISRYTLRLLAIQQFRRTLSMVTACEFLRVKRDEETKLTGWRPTGSKMKKDYLWGAEPFYAGLWTGQSVTPNRLNSTLITLGALDQLAVDAKRGDESDPAQVTKCPACGTTLSIPSEGMSAGEHTLYIVLKHDGNSIELPNPLQQGDSDISIKNAKLHTNINPSFSTLELLVDSDDPIMPGKFTTKVGGFIQRMKGVKTTDPVCSTHYSRPGYFFRNYIDTNNNIRNYDFEIICPNPGCPLTVPWEGASPTGYINNRSVASYIEKGSPGLNDNCHFFDILEPFQLNGEFNSDRIPIPALTVDDQIYRRIPSVIVSTVDKFARPAYEPRASSLFGNVEFHHPLYGFYREYLHNAGQSGHPTPSGPSNNHIYKKVRMKNPPDLILQDELHLIEGPLGAMVGAYETAIDYLCSENDGTMPKYIASTATIRNAKDQVKSVFNRRVVIFPTFGDNSDDRFFIREREEHSLRDDVPGRLYLGIAAPGRGALTPIYRIFSRLLKTGYDYANSPDIDRFWTVTGYFNSIRELAGALALYRQDIPQRVDYLSDPHNKRALDEDSAVELSSRVDAAFLPYILEKLETKHLNVGSNAVDALFTTSMFGTGIDVSRLGLMVVNGQPKTASSYIQSTGRIGREKGGLVITFMRVSRPRDLSHYEYFCGFHRQIQRFVEPVSAYPFALGVSDRVVGPISVFLLRNMRNTTQNWQLDGMAGRMSAVKTSNREVELIPEIFENRASQQPAIRRPPSSALKEEAKRKLELWSQVNKRANGGQRFRYVEYGRVSCNVVLGDPPHSRSNRYMSVYDNSPTSLRDIEETTSFQT